MTIFLTEKSIDDMIDTKRNGIKKYKEEEYGLQKKEKFDMEGRILSFFDGRENPFFFLWYCWFLARSLRRSTQGG